MSNFLNSLVASTGATKEQQLATQRMLRTILIIVILTSSLVGIVDGLIFKRPSTLYGMAPLAVIAMISLIYLQRQILWPARIIIPLGTLISISYVIWVGNGVHDVGISSLGIVVILAGLTLGGNGLIVFGLLTSLAVAMIGIAEMNGYIAYPFGSVAVSDIIIISIAVIAGAMLLRLLLNRLEQTIMQLLQSEQEQRNANAELLSLKDSLENRVNERTSELLKRANQLEAISNVARSTTSLQGIEELLPMTTKLVSDRFGYYHAGIFLLDENREFALLKASNSEGGQRMLARQHKLRLDANSMVGFVTSRGLPRIALDVGIDAVFFNNPELPDTRSEMALPLRVGGRVIGALDVQSTQANAFTEEDIATLSTLADQLAIAIENARLFSESRKALKEAEETFTRYVKQEWGTFTAQMKHTGYLFDGKRSMPLDDATRKSAARSMLQTGSLSLEKNTGKINVPIKFRGQIIGFLDVTSKKGNRQWTSADIALLEAAAERAALALENARLVETSQRRASREQTIGEISTKIGAVSNLDAIMQAAVEELGRRIGGTAEITLEIGSESEK